MNSYKKLLKKELKNLPLLTSEKKLNNYSYIAKGNLYELLLTDWHLARNERDEPVKLTAIFSEYLRLLLDYRINVVICGGCAQIGKSLFAILAYSYTVSKLGYNAIFLFPQQQAQDRLVPLNHRPVVENWEKLLFQGKKRNLIANNQVFKSLSTGSVIYSYTAHKAQNNDGASASTAIVSVSADILFVDEVSQYPKGAIEMVYRRLDASRIPTRPKRLLGTAGNGGGIERFIKDADYNFYPSVVCESCKQIAFLDPFGALLKSEINISATGETYTNYLTSTGRPNKWHLLDATKDRQSTNNCHIRCPHCEALIDDDLIFTASFRDRKSFIGLSEYLDTIQSIEDCTGFISVSIELSPLLRGNSRMSELLREGLSTASPNDWVQQSLGKPSEFGITSIQPELILAGFGKELPKIKVNPYGEGQNVITIAGIDQGHSSDHVVIIRYYYNQDFYDLAEIAEKSTRYFLYFGSVNRLDIPEILKTYKVDFGFIDNEPSIDSASELVRQTNCLMLADQQAKQKDDFIKSHATDGGQDFSCIKIKFRKFSRNLIAGFSRLNDNGQPLYQFHPDLNWVKTISKDLSPVSHLCSVVYDPDTGNIIRPVNHVDHYFYATMFAESAFNYFLVYDTYGAGNNSSVLNWV